MTQAAENTFPCQDCGETVYVAHPEVARCVVCDACGAQHDLYATGGPVIGHVPIRSHRPEGLLELGLPGQMGQRLVQIIGRLRLADMEGTKVRTWDEWIVLTNDGMYLRIREEQGNYALLIPFEPGTPAPGSQVERMDIGGVVLFAGVQAKVTRRSPAKVLLVEGEHASRICVGDRVMVIELQTPEGPVSLMSTMEGVSHFTMDAVEDRAMWAIFGYHDMLRAFDALFLAERRNRKVSRGVAQASMALLGCSLLGGLWLFGVVASARPIHDDWARFDGEPRTEMIEQVMGGPVLLEPGLGYYEMDMTCDLDTSSQSMAFIAESAAGERITLGRCLGDGRRAHQGELSTTFRVDAPEEWTFKAVHHATPRESAHAAATYALTWRLGALWIPMYSLLVLVGLGLLVLVAYPFARTTGLSRLNEEFDRRRTELNLRLRLRNSDSAQGDQTPVGGD